MGAERGRSQSAVLGVIVAIFMVVVFRQFSKPNIDKEIAKACAEQSRECPKMVDEATRLDAIEQEPERTVSYKYTMVSYAKEDLNVPKFKEALETMLNEKVRATKETKKLLDMGIRMKFSYYDKNGEYLCEVLVGS